MDLVVGNITIITQPYKKLHMVSGVKKSLVLVPGTSWISGRTSIYFHPMSGGQVQNSMLVYFSLTRTSYLVTGQVKILMYLPRGQVKIFRFFYPWVWINPLYCFLASKVWHLIEIQDQDTMPPSYDWSHETFFKGMTP